MVRKKPSPVGEGRAFPRCMILLGKSDEQQVAPTRATLIPLLPPKADDGVLYFFAIKLPPVSFSQVPLGNRMKA